MMTWIRRFARRHKLMLQIAGVILVLALLGIAVGAVVFAVLEACGLSQWAALIWLLANL
ncbi:hypothetical protein PT279_08980 [Bifidobacterium sp. ESL0784]|uniref:hypothetical protein n=1 Tax=Bifidobacterium sp. ESL0784 TaxID=2983231 RepID=UPI0023F69A16|nr:hypothetical protein [Bifidobacterium sp. ESL0784]MDF7641715.1 hypothetical protein [Bifidobacterium sp. ESL0784]